MGTCFVTPPTTLNTLTVVIGESWPGLVDAILDFKSAFLVSGKMDVGREGRY